MTELIIVFTLGPLAFGVFAFAVGMTILDRLKNIDAILRWQNGIKRDLPVDRLFVKGSGKPIALEHVPGNAPPKR